MPIVKPAALPRFGELAGSQGVIGPNEVAPNAAKQDVGWVPGEQPPAGYFNWFQRLVYDWIQYLNDLTNQALTWVGQQQFSGNKLQHVGDPFAADDAATKNYVDVTDKAAAHTWAALQGFSAATIANAPVNPTDAVRKTELDAITSLAHMRSQTADGATAVSATGSPVKFAGFAAARKKTVGAMTNDGVGRITVTNAGTYRIFGSLDINHVSVTGTGAGVEALQIFKNGLVLDELSRNSVRAATDDGFLAGEMVADLAAGDYVEVFYIVTLPGGSATFYGGQLTVQRVA